MHTLVLSYTSMSYLNAYLTSYAAYMEEKFVLFKSFVDKISGWNVVTPTIMNTLHIIMVKSSQFNNNHINNSLFSHWKKKTREINFNMWCMYVFWTLVVIPSLLEKMSKMLCTIWNIVEALVFCEFVMDTKPIHWITYTCSLIHLLCHTWMHVQKVTHLSWNTDFHIISCTRVRRKTSSTQ